MAHDSSDIDQSIIATLGADSTLLSYCPGGVYWQEAPPGSTRFVAVSLIASVDEATFDGRATEDGLYLVKAVMSSKANGNIKAAAARIDVLLDDPLTLGLGSPPSIPGYTFIACFREERIRYTEVDVDDASTLWHHRGGLYRVQMYVNP